MIKVNGYATQSPTSLLAPFNFERRDLRPNDVLIDILYCGICHSDIHTARNEWKNTVYPAVLGHEIIGKVKETGIEVKGLKPGDTVAVGCMVDTCGICPNCREGYEQYCNQTPIWTYNSRDRHDGTITYGGYSTQIVVDKNFVLLVPKEFKEKDYPSVAPLLCAGITTYSPLRHWNTGRGSRVGVVGLGGLGHMAIKLAHAMGSHVVLFTTSPGKAQDAKKFGANEVVISKNADDVKKYVHSLDLIIDTVSVSHDLDLYLSMLKRDGILCLLGAPEKPHPSPTIFQLISKRRSLAGSGIGSIKETQEMLNFCAKHQITCEIEMIPIQKINEAYERMIKNDVKYRFVIDIASLRSPR